VTLRVLYQSSSQAYTWVPSRAGQLAAAKAATAWLWRPLEEAGFRDVAEHAALVLSCATDPARPRRELDQAVAGLHHAAANLAGLARRTWKQRLVHPPYQAQV